MCVCVWMGECLCVGVEGWMGGCMGACVCSETGDKICKISVFPLFAGNLKLPQMKYFNSIPEYQSLKPDLRIRTQGRKKRRINRPRKEKHCFPQDANDIMMNLKRLRKKKEKVN